jgi:enoyl-[acyl-carrier-protein] reductase (NADH)|tara:strand:+ start:99 stop:329 length:231 start_codon:yes stop_codon:yes gene_type:complete
MKCDYDNCDKESGNIKPNNDLCELHNISQSRYEIESEIEQCRYEIKTQLENLDLLFDNIAAFTKNKKLTKLFTDFE